LLESLDPSAHPVVAETLKELRDAFRRSRETARRGAAGGTAARHRHVARVARAAIKASAFRKRSTTWALRAIDPTARASRS
jgi:hypothetical protein